MKPIIFLAGTPEYKILQELKPTIKQAIFDAFSSGYFNGEFHAIMSKSKEPSSQEVINEITLKAMKGDVPYDIDSAIVRYLIIED